MHDRVRLHISPFTPDLLPLILPATIRGLATEVSFHELPNFPERNYGYVSLPTMEASKLRKKVNGSILKGSKVKVEEARPKKSARVDAPEDNVDEGHEAPEAQAKRAKKRKRQEGVIPGYELENERKVKRGWTEPVAAKIQEKRQRKGKDKSEKKTKKQEASEYTDDAECLFKTNVPPNKEDLKSMEKSKTQKKKGKKTTVVHEFEKTEKQPSFLRSDGGKDKNPVAEYDDEKGWVDDSGKIIEEIPKKSKQKAARKESTSSSSSDDAPAIDYERLGSLTLREQQGKDEEMETSSSGTSSDSSDSDSDSESGSSAAKAPVPAEPKKSVSASPAPKISIEDSPALSASVTPAPSQHPLEALYKKPALPGPSSAAFDKNKSSLSVEAVPFSFFTSDGGPPLTANFKSSVESAAAPLTSPPSASSTRAKRGAAARLPNLAIPPSTPFTQRDMMWRGQRSAAPTPDTAMPGKGGGFPGSWGRSGHGSRLSTDEIEEENDDEVMASVEAPVAEEPEAEAAAADGAEEGNEDTSDDDEDDDDDNDDADDTPVKSKGKDADGKPQSTFAKEFYEKRGEFNREWKRVRRDAGKAQRAAANRRRKA